MTTNAPVPPEHHRNLVSLSGLFVAADRFRAELRWPEREQDMHFTCFRGHVAVQITRGAGNAETRRDIVILAADVIGGTAHVDEHLHEAADPTIWGSYIVHGTFMETPIFVYTSVSPDEASRLGWGSLANVIELPLDTAGGER